MAAAETGSSKSSESLADRRAVPTSKYGVLDIRLFQQRPSRIPKIQDGGCQTGSSYSSVELRQLIN